MSSRHMVHVLRHDESVPAKPRSSFAGLRGVLLACLTVFAAFFVLLAFAPQFSSTLTMLQHRLALSQFWN
ncbi:MAG TPA: hypothetical protein VHA07_08035 [Devosia sp.]|nr:hypothetical protein [Devosia sp.]